MNNKDTSLKPYKYVRVQFTRIDSNLILSEGVILKQLNKRHRKKKTVLEYYKCKSGCSKSPNLRNGKCKFSGKLTYQIGSEPLYLEKIHQHSHGCLQNNDHSTTHQKKTYTKQRKGKIHTPPKVVKYSQVPSTIFQDSVPIVDIKIQLKNLIDSESNNSNDENDDEDNEEIISEEEEEEENENEEDQNEEEEDQNENKEDDNKSNNNNNDNSNDSNNNNSAK